MKVLKSFVYNEVATVRNLDVIILNNSLSKHIKKKTILAKEKSVTSANKCVFMENAFIFTLSEASLVYHGKKPFYW